MDVPAAIRHVLSFLSVMEPTTSAEVRSRRCAEMRRGSTYTWCRSAVMWRGYRMIVLRRAIYRGWIAKALRCSVSRGRTTVRWHLGGRRPVRSRRRICWPRHILQRRTITVHKAAGRRSWPHRATRIDHTVPGRHHSGPAGHRSWPHAHRYVMRIVCKLWAIHKRSACSGQLQRRRSGTVYAAIDDGCASSNVSRPVVDYGAVIPAATPVAPSPSPRRPRAQRNAPGKAHAEAPAKAYAYEECWWRSVVVARPGDNRRSINDPWIVDRHVYDIRICWFDLNIAIVFSHSLLGSVCQGACLLRALAHTLHGVHHVLRLVVIRVAQVCRPLHVVVHLFEHGRKRSQSLHAWVPGLRICGRGNLVRRSIALCLTPLVGLNHLGWIRRSSQNLRHQSVRIERNRRYELVELVGRQRLCLLLLCRGRLLVLWLLLLRVVGRQRRTILGDLLVAASIVLRLLLVLCIRRRRRHILC